MATATTESDDSWIDRYVQEVGRRAFQFAAAMLKDAEISEDIVQEAFVRAWLSPRTPHVMPDFQRWLFRVIVNLVRDHQRRETHWLGILPRLASPAPQPSSGAGNPAIRQAIDRLSPREREAVYLRFFSDFSYEDVAAAMGIREATARVLVFRAMDKLRWSLGGLHAATGGQL